ncbi:winged helix-turn-helix domain-containing protein [Thalassomonas actiniarum]|uniref:Winged helix-turn-helix domain-containing protein n=1 Tax=Thalassomonas actiniarum TaxID=485447 RepID=A0AAE9YNT7_9GAMM|nr:transcriptional regulator [Thalassomonas actiniarum]WDD98250.1 winged helix-turn-helix domain-containing protein [Thalassomonas actiniarum]
MSAQYWVGDFFIDLTRNQITQKTQSQTIPPKALAVLTYLAKNANKVVSHDELLSEVWPDTVVTPNTLQRSIARLRKALGEDSQSYIKTHAKQGYSLEVEVRWQALTDTESQMTQGTLSAEVTAKDDVLKEQAVVPPQIERADLAKSSRSVLTLNSPLIGIVILGIIAMVSFIGVNYLTPAQGTKLAFTELRSLTTTDHSESNGNYTPDGQYIVFNRFPKDLCVNNLWAKNVNTQEEFQLTKNLGSFGEHSFSKDGKELVIIEKEDCNKPITQKQCYKLSNLDFHKALETPQTPGVLMECKNSTISNPKWLNNSNVAFLQEFSSRRQLTSYSIADSKSIVIYKLDEGNINDFDYSSKEDLIALTSTHSDGQKYIEILKPDGKLLSSYQIKYPKEIADLRDIYPNFMPQTGQLIFSTGRQFFTLSYQGNITNISLPLDEPMGSPLFHPDGNRMLMTKAIFDTDIAKLPLSQFADAQAEHRQKQNEAINNYSVLQRSIRVEQHGIFQPNGRLVAFRSRRSGQEQLWITDGLNPQQLTNFPLDTRIGGMNWAMDGASILVNANRKLTQVFLEPSDKPISIPLVHSVERLFQWDSEANTALMNVRIKGIIRLVEFNLNSSELRVIHNNPVKWALKTEDGRLIYTDHMDRFWQSGPAEYQLIDALENQGSDKPFLVKNNVIYGISDELQLWSYDLNENVFKLLGKTLDDYDYLTDINQTDILLTVMITGKKEVAELILSE